MGAQIQVIGNALREMAYRVRDRGMKARVEFTTRAEPTDRFRCFQEQHALTTFRQICGANQAIVPTTDNDGIVLAQVMPLVVQK